jgi:hypothetical protein
MSEERELNPDTTVVLYDSSGSPRNIREIDREERAERVLRLKEIDLNELEPRSVDSNDGVKMIMIGKPKSGKSVMLKAVMRAKSFIPVVQVHSGTEDSNKSFSECVPQTFIFNKLDNEAVKGLIARQKYAIQYKLDNPWACIVCDDVFDRPSEFKNPLWLSIFKNSRHWKLVTLIAMQYVLDIVPSERSMIEYSFLFAEPSENSRKKLYDNFGSAVGNYRDFCDIMGSSATEDYRAIVFKNLESSNKLEDRICWAKANVDVVKSHWKFGSPAIWHHAEIRQDPNYKEDVY